MIFILISLIWVPIFNFNIPKPDSQIKVISWNLGLLLASGQTESWRGKCGNFAKKKKQKNAKLPTSSDNEKGSRAGSAGWGRPDPTSIGVESEEGAAGAGGGRRYNLGW